MAFDINMKDVTGQSALYLACYVGNQKLVDLLLKHRVQGRRVKVGTPFVVLRKENNIYSIGLEDYAISNGREQKYNKYQVLYL